MNNWVPAIILSRKRETDVPKKMFSNQKDIYTKVTYNTELQFPKGGRDKYERVKNTAPRR